MKQGLHVMFTFVECCCREIGGHRFGEWWNVKVKEREIQLSTGIDHRYHITRRCRRCCCRCRCASGMTRGCDRCRLQRLKILVQVLHVHATLLLQCLGHIIEIDFAATTECTELCTGLAHLDDEGAQDVDEHIARTVFDAVESSQ